MKIDKCRHIFGMILGGMMLLMSSCDKEAVSVEQEESFLKYYPLGTEDNTGTRVIRRSDGYAILCNFENSSGQEDILVVFTDRFGRRTGESDPTAEPQLNKSGYNMISLDGGYLICGTSDDDLLPQRSGYLINISGDGTILWEKRYRGYAGLEFRDVILADDGSLVMTGSVSRNDRPDAEVMLFKTNAQGDSSWIKDWRYAGNDVGESIIEYDGFYHVLVTNTDVGYSSIRVFYATAPDARAGFNKDLPEEHLSGADIARDQEGRIFVLANQQDPANRLSMIYLAELELQETAGGKQMAIVKTNIIPDPDGGSLLSASFIPVGGDMLVIGGSWRKTSQGDLDILFLEVDNDFQIMGEKKTFGAKTEQAAQDIIATTDGGYALTGSVDLGGGKTTMLLKINQDKELK